MLVSDDSNKMFRCELRSLFYCAEINFAGDTIRAMDVHETDVFAALEDILWRCKTDNTHTCRVMYHADTPINALALTKDAKRIFIGLNNKIMLCDASTANSCVTYSQTSAKVNSLATTTEYLYAGLANDQMLRCELSEPGRCSKFQKGTIKSVTATENYVFAGLETGAMMRCSTRLDTCTTFNWAGQPINTLDIYGDVLYAGLKSGIIWKCDASKAHSRSTVTTRTSQVNSLKVIPGASEACVFGVRLPVDWNYLSLRNRTTVDYEFNVTRRH